MEKLWVVWTAGWREPFMWCYQFRTRAERRAFCSGVEECDPHEERHAFYFREQDAEMHLRSLVCGVVEPELVDVD